MRVFRFIHAEKANHKIATMCAVLGVSRAGYHAWARRGPSTRARRDAELSEQIRGIHADSKRRYGPPGAP